MITANQYSTTQQVIQKRHARIELLNSNFLVVDELSGNVTGGNITIDAESDMRRSGSLELVVTDASFEVESGGKIFLDRYIRVFMGVEVMATGEIEWTNCGTYIVDGLSYRYDAQTNTLSFSLLDLMANLTGVRNGYLPGVPVLISAGESIRGAMIDTLALGGFTRYIIEDTGELPQDLEFAQGATVYDVLAGLRDIYPFYQIYFDVDGVFHYEHIPTGSDEPIQIDDDTWDKVVLDESVDVDFQNVKNVVEVWGRTHDPAYFATNTTYSGSAITLTVSGGSYVDGAIYGFTLTDNPGFFGATLRVGSLTAYPIYNSNNEPAVINAESGEVYYCVQYVVDTTVGNHWLWLGHLQAYGYNEDASPDSPFYVDGSVGRIRLVLYGGEYDNCFTDDLAQQRADYELWLHTNLNNTITLTTTPIYWLDVNLLGSYTLRRNSQQGTYLIKSISYGFGVDETMTVTMMTYYAQPQWWFWFDVPTTNLILYYTTATAPDFSVDENGHLIYNYTGEGTPSYYIGNDGHLYVNA